MHSFRRQTEEMKQMIDHESMQKFADRVWQDSITGELIEYIRIPNKSPHFDPQWAEHGHMDKAAAHMERWCREQPIGGMQVELVRLPGRTPVLVCEIPGQNDDTVLLYGHLDKQPEMSGWRDDLGPWKPVLEGERLFGRGGADDGYAVYASLTAIRALAEQDIPHARCFVLIEACEESGSFDLPYYIDHLRDRIGKPSLVVCLDSGCGDYERMWSTTSLRGLVAGTLSIENLTEGVHSGNAGGIVPSTFRIARALLSRIEDESSGQITADILQAQIPEQRRQQAVGAAQALGDKVYSAFPWHGDSTPAQDDTVELILNRTWRAALEITGADGLPASADAGNVARPKTELKLSLRVPPTTDVEAATAAVKTILESQPPHGASVTFTPDTPGPGWESPPCADWLNDAMNEASSAYFGEPAAWMGEGGSIPFMGMLGEKFPQAQFLVTGVLGPNSNAHGPNEFLDLPTARRLTCCVALVLARHFAKER
ncbi:MAG: acetylornithine deacetylase/succinyl-diaminopimelate desuccinylase-like protein [Gammaproteobacteria bacterium]|jgi:acetylornithine deacetylase/succinyl-diaminopimelate desuccinylase-like protein